MKVGGKKVLTNGMVATFLPVDGKPAVEIRSEDGVLQAVCQTYGQAMAWARGEAGEDLIEFPDDYKQIHNEFEKTL